MFEWASWESSNDLLLELCITRRHLRDATRSYRVEKIVCESYRKDIKFLQDKISKLERTNILLDGVNSELRSQIDKLKWETKRG